MNVPLNYKEVSGAIKIPSSKSHSQRALAAALLHNGNTIIRNIGDSKDEQAALRIIQQLGAKIEFAENKIHIFSNRKIHPNKQIDCGESGLAARLFTPIAALGDTPVTIAGSGSLLHRPMDFFEKIFSELQVALRNFNGKIPFEICGPLQPRNVTIDGSISSQFISGLLFAFCNAVNEKVTLEVANLTSKPYIDLTIEVLAHFGKNVKHSDYQFFEIDPKNFSTKKEIEITIEGDWSSAAFWIAAAAINGSVKLLGLQQHSVQADKVALDIAKKMGANVGWQNDELHISSNQLLGIEIDLSDSPDLFPVLAVLAACANGESRLKGLHRLIHKESNRAESIAHILAQLGVTFKIEKDTLIIKGQSNFFSLKYDCPNDHRMAMAAALASMRCEGIVTIENAECVAKSYPNFWNDLLLRSEYKYS